jgi:hypothetical protein
MSLLTHLVFQPIEPNEDIPTENREDDFILDDGIDEEGISQFWSEVQSDIHQ